MEVVALMVNLDEFKRWVQDKHIIEGFYINAFINETQRRL